MVELDRLQKWSDRNLMVFDKGKCQVLHLQRTSTMHQYMLKDQQLESSFAGDCCGPGGKQAE